MRKWKGRMKLKSTSRKIESADLDRLDETIMTIVTNKTKRLNWWMKKLW